MTEFWIDVQKIEGEVAHLNEVRSQVHRSRKILREVELNDSCYASVMRNINDIENMLDVHCKNIKALSEGLHSVLLLYKNMEKDNLSIKGMQSFDFGVPTPNPENLPYDEYIEYRIENAVDENTKKIYKKYSDKLNIVDTDYENGGKYNGFFNHMKLNEENDNKNPRGKGTTHFHEYGHMVDDLSDFNGRTSNDWSYDFGDTLKKDYENYIDKVMIDNGFTDKIDAYQYVENWINGTDADNKNGVSDLVTGLSDGNINGKWFHDSWYYTETKLEREAFAHFFEASMCTDSTKLDYIKEVFPESYKVYQQMLEDDLNN